jgi:3-methyladenine DNA glycosylase AlkD
MTDSILSSLEKVADHNKAALLSHFFKTGKGGYGEGDIFLGVTVPQQRKVALSLLTIPLEDVSEALNSPIHESRLTALIILVYKYKKSDQKQKKEIYSFYLKNIQFVNNWDLVDASSRDIVGNYLLDKNREVLYRLAVSKNIWERRVAIVATYEFIRNNDFADTLKIAEILLNDKHDLIHKAVGWMLREVGNREFKVEESFVKEFYKQMPRTMLRYAIEKFPDEKRKLYMQK